MKYKKLIWIIIVALIIIFFTPFLIQQHYQHLYFRRFISEIKQEAIKQGLPETLIDTYLAPLYQIKSSHKKVILKNESHQAQEVLTLSEYLQRFVSTEKINRARIEWDTHRELLEKISQHYHVQPQYLVALWGIESNFGDYTGDFPIVQSLAILAYHSHRSSFYRRQLLDALIILNSKHIIPQMLKSSWDGGMGQTQFEPSTYLHYAVDFNGDGFKNIWTNLPDVFASIANFLHAHGWDDQQPWGIMVKLPAHFPKKLASRYIVYSIPTWNKLGVRQLNGEPLKSVPGKQAILLFSPYNSLAYLTYPNFNVLLQWNDTTYESIAVGTLADKINIFMEQKQQKFHKN